MGHVDDVIKFAQEYCEEHGFRFTEPRRLTLQVIVESVQPIGAYDIIDAIGKIADKPKPTTVYRAIDFLQQQGFIHKIESLNAFVACHAGHNHRGSQFVICNDCGNAEEIHLCNLPADLQKQLKQSGFDMAYWNTEIHGVCNDCKPQTDGKQGCGHDGCC